MHDARPLQALGALAVGAGAVAVWVAFQRQMCLAAGDCAPNVVYLVPGVLAALAGLVLLAVARRRRLDRSPDGRT